MAMEVSQDLGLSWSLVIGRGEAVSGVAVGMQVRQGRAGLSIGQQLEVTG